MRERLISVDAVSVYESAGRLAGGAMCVDVGGYSGQHASNHIMSPLNERRIRSHGHASEAGIHQGLAEGSPSLCPPHSRRRSMPSVGLDSKSPAANHEQYPDGEWWEA